MMTSSTRRRPNGRIGGGAGESGAASAQSNKAKKELPRLNGMIQSRSVREWAAHCLTLALALTVIGVGSGTAGPTGPADSLRQQVKQGKGKRCAQGSLECVFCASFNRHGEALKHATREVGALPN